MKKLLIIASILFSTDCYSQQYQSFSGFTHIHNIDDSELHSSSFHSRYYFSAKNSIGPLDQFEYVNTTDNIFLRHNRSQSLLGDLDSTTVGGEKYHGKLMGGAVLSQGSDQDNYRVMLGYMLTDDQKLGVEVFKSDIFDPIYMATYQHNHRISGSDYLGFRLLASDEFNFRSVEAKWFKSFENNRYFVAEAYYSEGDLFADKYFSLTYYFDKRTSLTGSVLDDEQYEVGAKHFFTNRLNLSLNYRHRPEFSDMDSLTVTFGYQL